jgi:hypothetical protein
MMFFIGFNMLNFLEIRFGFRSIACGTCKANEGSLVSKENPRPTFSEVRLGSVSPF